MEYSLEIFIQIANGNFMVYIFFKDCLKLVLRVEEKSNMYVGEAKRNILSRYIYLPLIASF